MTTQTDRAAPAETCANCGKACSSLFLSQSQNRHVRRAFCDDLCREAFFDVKDFT